MRWRVDLGRRSMPGNAKGHSMDLREEAPGEWKVFCGKCGLWGMVKGDRNAARDVFAAHLDHVATREGATGRKA